MKIQIIKYRDTLQLIFIRLFINIDTNFCTFRRNSFLVTYQHYMYGEYIKEKLNIYIKNCAKCPCYADFFVFHIGIQRKLTDNGHGMKQF